MNMGKDKKMECACGPDNCNCWTEGSCNCEWGNCACGINADGTKNTACRCQWWCGAMCGNCKGKMGSKVGKLLWLLVLAWLLRWLRWSFMGWWTDVDIDTTPDNPQEEAIWWQKIWLVADEEEAEAVDPVEVVDPVDPVVVWDWDTAEIDEADLNEIVEILEDVLE